MGRSGGRQPLRNSNHHDNPHRVKKHVIRRQHSQAGLGNGNQKVNDRPNSKKQQARTSIPFQKGDRILLVGEGDFSFTLSLASQYGFSNMVATCFDAKDALEHKYPDVLKIMRKFSTTNPQPPLPAASRAAGEDEDIWNGFSSSEHSQQSEDDKIESIASKAARTTTVLYGIDATKLSTAHKKVLKPYSPFTKIVFNFPHVGGISTDVNRQVRANQQLLVNFFNSVKPLLATPVTPAARRASDDDEDSDALEYDSDSIKQKSEYLNHGQIMVTLFEGEPYSLWNIRDLARHCGLKVLESFKFPWTSYPGYHHARTIGDITTGKDRSEEGKRKGAWRGEERDARCYVLALKDDDDGRPAPGSRKRKKEANNSD